MKDKSSQLGIFAAFFGFKRMISPFFIGLVYSFGLIAIIATTITIMSKGPHLTLAKYGLDFESGLLVIACYICILLGGLISLFIWRFICEMAIVLFGIHRLLEEIQQMVVEPIEAELSAQRVQATIAPALPSADKSSPTCIELATEDNLVTESADYEKQILESTPEVEPVVSNKETLPEQTTNASITELPTKKPKEEKEE
ncbi:MAG: DUF4282 domain-containing protein [Robiginitomaculum sp.]|nr:DUF4282 domain-containing protein [Robiginitomaculum sp.]